MSISAREPKGSLAPGVTFTELNIRDATGSAPLIRVEDEFVSMLEQHVRAEPDADGQSVAGFLLGTEERGALRVTGFQPLAAAGLRSLQGVVNGGNARKAHPGAIGFYRAARQLNHLVSRDDLVLFKEYFPGGSALFLQLRLSGGPVAAGVFYLGRNGSLQSDRRSVEWPVNLGELGAGEVPPVPAAAPAPRKRRRDLLRWLLASAALAFVATLLWSLWPLPRRARPASPLPVAEAPVSIAVDGAPAMPGTKPPAAASSPRRILNTPRPRPAAALPTPTSAAEAPVSIEPPRMPASGLPLEARQPDATPNASAPQADSLSLSPQPAELRPRIAPTGEVLAAPPGAAPQPDSPPRLRLQVTPAVSPLLMRRIQGFMIVSIRVDVDEAGHVVSAVPLSGGSGLHSQLAAAVVDAVRRWQFEPARQGGRAVRSQAVLHFKYVNP